MTLTVERKIPQAKRRGQDTLFEPRKAFDTVLNPHFLCGDALSLLKNIPSQSIDCCITSPPYWGHREYQNDGIGLEKDYEDYIKNILDIIKEVRRVLKPSGSLWLNLGDTYVNKNLMGIPWRIALKLMESGFILRNSIIWNKLKGSPDNSKDKLRNLHENVFHFVIEKSYFYDTDAIRSKPRPSRVENGRAISATGVSGVRYKRQIELSASLSAEEKMNALKALNFILNDVKTGKISDFRMVIRDQQRITHSDQNKVSGRAKELQKSGFYFLKYHPNGAKPSDVWEILPEDTQKRVGHYAAFPEDLCVLPILATCPTDGIVLDPFCGTGTVMRVAMNLKRKSIGIDLSEQYLEIARVRCGLL